MHFLTMMIAHSGLTVFGEFQRALFHHIHVAAHGIGLKSHCVMHYPKGVYARFVCTLRQIPKTVTPG